MSLPAILDRYGRPLRPDTEERNLAFSQAIYTRSAQPIWSDWTLAKAVGEGYKVNGWVYAAVTLIMDNVAAVPIVVRSYADDSIEWDHPVTRMLENPSPIIPRGMFLKLAIAWLLLCGNAYLYRVITAARTREMWLISPDRLKPIPSAERLALVVGYALDGKPTADPDFRPETIIHWRLPNPANPLEGIGPLQAAARAVDTDVQSQAWNMAIAQNRGIVDGLLTYRGGSNQPTLSQPQADAIYERLSERAKDKSLAAIPKILGAGFDYLRLSLTPEDLQALESRRWNRDEIGAIFGIPPQLLGSSEVMTRDNYGIALRRMWEMRLIPLLSDLADLLNLSLRSELGEHYYIGYDLSGVQALKEDEEPRARTAETYWRMGIPVSVLNDKLALGLTKFPGWDQPWTGQGQSQYTADKPPAGQGEGEDRRAPRPELRAWHQRDIRAEKDLWERLSEGPVLDFFQGLLDLQKAAVFSALNAGEDVAEALAAVAPNLASEMSDVYRSTAREFVGTVQIRKGPATAESPSESIIKDWIDNGLLANQDLKHMDETTATAILEQVVDAASGGKTIAEVQQAIIDLGVFDARRALMLARTLTTTAQSIGQLAGAEEAGATHKKWNSALDAVVRPAHAARNGKVVPLNNLFDGKWRCPGDPRMPPGERIACRCSLSFSIQE